MIAQVRVGLLNIKLSMVIINAKWRAWRGSTKTPEPLTRQERRKLEKTFNPFQHCLLWEEERVLLLPKASAPLPGYPASLIPSNPILPFDPQHISRLTFLFQDCNRDRDISLKQKHQRKWGGGSGRALGYSAAEGCLSNKRVWIQVPAWHAHTHM